MSGRSVITIGNFDGVHRGHQAILTAGRALADQLGIRLEALTFDPSPREVLQPDHAPRRLCTAQQRLEWLKAAGADHVIVLDPRHGLLDTPAREFLEWLERHHPPAAMVEGPDFRFGHQRQGDLTMLRKWALSRKIDLVVAPKLLRQINDHHNLELSSSVCRELLRLGRVRELELCLGRPFTLRGVVTVGEKRGRALGVPTANLQTDDRQMLPSDGVYAGRASIGGAKDAWWPAAISVGIKPTFATRRRIIEAHLLGYAGDLYDQSLDLTFEHWVRDQQRFPNVTELAAQLRRDLDKTRDLLRLDQTAGFSESNSEPLPLAFQ